MHRSLLRTLAASLVVLLAAQPLLATCGGGGGGGGGGMGASAGSSEQVYHVPWQVAEAEAAPTEGLILYWFPASADELKVSPLRTSRTLALFSGQCVAMQVAGAGSPIGKKLRGRGRAGRRCSRRPPALRSAASPAQNDRLDVGAVEKLVSDELKRREDGGQEAARGRQGQVKSRRQRHGHRAAQVGVVRALPVPQASEGRGQGIEEAGRAGRQGDERTGRRSVAAFRRGHERAR